MIRSYDLVVLGSGPAGEKGAAQAAYFGKKVALVERDEVLGGVSCNTGSLPSKTLRESALALSGVRSRNLLGVDLAVRRGATVHDFLAHERRVTSAEREAIVENVRRHNIDVYHGEASFADPHTVKVSRTTRQRYSFVATSSSSRPVRPHSGLRHSLLTILGYGTPTRS